MKTSRAKTVKDDLLVVNSMLNAAEVELGKASLESSLKDKLRKTKRAGRKSRSPVTWLKYGSADTRVLTRAEIKRAIDETLIERNLTLEYQLRNSLKTAFPQTSTKLLNRIAVDFADIWHNGELHRRSVAAVLKLKHPRDARNLLDVLYTVHIRLLGRENDFHVRSLRRYLPKLFDQIDNKHRTGGQHKK